MTRQYHVDLPTGRLIVYGADVPADALRAAVQDAGCEVTA